MSSHYLYAVPPTWLNDSNLHVGCYADVVGRPFCVSSPSRMDDDLRLSRLLLRRGLSYQLGVGVGDRNGTGKGNGL